MSKQFELALRQVEEGKAGLNEGLSMGIRGLDTNLYNLQKRTYYLIGGETGTGKTAFVDTCFVINPIMKLFDLQSKGETDLDIDIDYYTLEIDSTRKINKWICIWFYRKYNIIVDINLLLSRGRNRLPDDIYLKYLEAQEFVEKMMDKVNFIEGRTYPTGISINTRKWHEQNGRIETTTVKRNGLEYKERKFIPNSNKLIKEIIVDHVGLLGKEKGKNKKENLDTLSANIIEDRNLYGCSYTLLSQFNRDLADVKRQMFKELRPQLSDFKDTGNLSEDAETVIAMFNPMRYNIREYQGYQIARVGRRMRFATILKNRDGDADVIVPLNFLGEAGYFRGMRLTGPEMTETEMGIISNFTKYG